MVTTEDKSLKKKDNIELTESNFLMLKHIEHGKKVKDAYELVYGKGKNPQAPYQMYHRIKKKLEMVYEADNVDSLRLKIEAAKIMNMKVEDKPVKPEVKLKAIETLARLTDSKKEEKKVISPFIIFKAEDGQISASQGKVVEAEIVETDENEES